MSKNLYEEFFDELTDSSMQWCGCERFYLDEEERLAVMHKYLGATRRRLAMALRALRNINGAHGPWARYYLPHCLAAQDALDADSARKALDT